MQNEPFDAYHRRGKMNLLYIQQKKGVNSVKTRKNTGIKLIKIRCGRCLAQLKKCENTKYTHARSVL